MRRFWLACTMVIVVGISSCVDSDKDLYQEAGQTHYIFYYPTPVFILFI